MAPVRSKRLRLLDGMCRTLCDLLHTKVFDAARARGWGRPPENTSAIYALACAEAPALLDQLFAAHHMAVQERNEPAKNNRPKPENDKERKQMLSAIRASIVRTSGKFVPKRR